MVLEITDIKVGTVGVPLDEPFAIATETMGSCDHIVATVETNEGICGLGAVSTIPAFMGETTEIVEAGIRFLATVVLGRDPFDIEAICEAMDAALAGNPTAKAAIDFACHDIMGKCLEVPVHRLIGGLYRRRLDCTWVIGIKGVAESVREAVDRVEDGYMVLKVKVGHDDRDDAEKVRLIREEVGPDVRIRLDANTAYSAERAVRMLEPLQAYDLEMIEQPCHKTDIAGMARVRQVLRTPILADESAMGLAEVRHIIDAGAADIINIKLSKVGGIHKARKVAAVAQASHIPVLIGSNMELGPGIAAGAHFGAATANIAYASDLYAGIQLHTHDIADDVWDRQGMTIAVPMGVGLGVALKESPSRVRSLRA